MVVSNVYIYIYKYVYSKHTFIYYYYYYLHVWSGRSWGKRVALLCAFDGAKGTKFDVHSEKQVQDTIYMYMRVCMYMYIFQPVCFSAFQLPSYLIILDICIHIYIYIYICMDVYSWIKLRVMWVLAENKGEKLWKGRVSMDVDK